MIAFAYERRGVRIIDVTEVRSSNTQVYGTHESKEKVGRWHPSNKNNSEKKTEQKNTAELNYPCGGGLLERREAVLVDDPSHDEHHGAHHG